MLEFDGSTTSIIESPMSRPPDSDGDFDGARWNGRDDDATCDEPFDEPLDEPNSQDMSASELFELVYDQLCAMAANQMRSQDPSHTLQSGDLLNEVYIRLVRSDMQFNGREHFRKVASGAMRQVLVDHARRRRAGKRPPRNRRVVLDDYVQEVEVRTFDLIELDGALTKLEAAYPDLARLVELHIFGGLTMRACAVVLDINERTAFRRWETARTFLYSAIRPQFEEGEA